MPGGAGYFCDNDSPPEIIAALSGGVMNWRSWCVENPTRIAEALRLIYPQHTVYREIACEELQFYETGKHPRAHKVRTASRNGLFGLR